ncbi:hypothetical protein NDU88_006987 [Pleurodeles waltl]|uniref:Uncharacterized protein n=1 Tax=Pleurodeles waltl TaxID=8319 RepID=A0AAV7UMM1_PLEWA|nr:hypothetical protein NDU88_006987 [Pleurodeles waltl]
MCSHITLDEEEERWPQGGEGLSVGPATLEGYFENHGNRDMKFTRDKPVAKRKEKASIITAIIETGFGAHRDIRLSLMGPPTAVRTHRRCPQGHFTEQQQWQ